MFDFQEKRKIRSLIYSKITIGIVLVATIPLVISVYERYSVEREMKEKRVVQEEALQELEERAQFLEGKVEHLENTRGIEEELSDRTVGFRIEDEDLEDLRTVRDAVDYVMGRVND